LISNVRSFRSGSVPDWIKSDKEESSVFADITDEIGASYKAGFKLKNIRRDFFINDKPQMGLKISSSELELFPITQVLMN